MGRLKNAGLVAVKVAVIGLVAATAIGFFAGWREIAAQGYRALVWSRSARLTMSEMIGLAWSWGGLGALLMASNAFLAMLLFRRAAAGWTAGLATPAALAAIVAALRCGLAKNFASLFPGAYASAPGLAPDTVFWVFLPPLVREILARQPWRHASTIGVLLGLTLAFALACSGATALAARLRRKEIRETGFSRPFWGLLFGATAIAAAIFGWPPGYVEPGRQHPDVILISIDTLRADAPGCYGRSPSPTPQLDRLAQTATRYMRVYAPAPWTIPSHAGLLTGLHNERHGAVTMDARLPKAAATLAERLAQKGYRTGAFVHSFMLSPRYGFGQGFQTYAMLPETDSADVAERAVDWLRERPSPVFLFLHLFDPHWPYGAAGEGLPGEDAESFHAFVQANLGADEATRRAWRSRYEAEVRRADAAVGRLFDELEQSGRWNDAWIVVASDHGEEFWEHGFLGHAITLHEEALRVPLLVKWPGQDVPKTIERPVSLLDVPATLIGELSLPGPQALDGLPLSFDAGPRRDFYASSAIWGSPRSALIRGCGKAITAYSWRFGDFSGERPDEYYNLCRAGGETNGRLWPAEGRALLADLKALAAGLERLSGESATGVSDEQREKLRALGYL